MPVYVQYGCGLSAPEGWLSYDASPTLLLRKTPYIGKQITNVPFPDNVKYGDILKRLKGVAPASADGVYCSHVLEHLSLADFRSALRNTYDLLKPGGIFRCVLPDLEHCINVYQADKQRNDPNASIRFMQSTMLGITDRPRSLTQRLKRLIGNSHHLWMWDFASLARELQSAGFVHIRRCEFNDSEDKQFTLVEESDRFENAVALEAVKP